MHLRWLEGWLGIKGLRSGKLLDIIIFSSLRSTSLYPLVSFLVFAEPTSQIPPTGPNSRIIAADVESFSPVETTAKTAAISSAADAPIFGDG